MRVSGENEWMKHFKRRLTYEHEFILQQSQVQNLNNFYLDISFDYVAAQ